MTPERYRQIGSIYGAALELEPSKRGAFLEEACAGDDALRAELESLLASNQDAGDFILASALETVAGELAKHQDLYAAGQRFSHYAIQSLVGIGGMAEVYLAEDESLHRKVALKLLPAAFAQDADSVRRFELEARSVSALNHPNIVTIYEIGRFKDRHYIATELIEGCTLRDRMAAGMTLKEVLDVAIQVAGALAAAHAAGVVHRDIKPENIMLRPDGYLKVLDFGLAKFVDKERDAVEEQASGGKFRTAKGLVLGTVGYLAPEQARGERVDARTDIFGLGVVLYEMIAGRGPFATPTMADTIAAILGGEPVPLRQLAGDIPAALERIVEKALMKSREDRYQSANEILVELKNLSLELEVDKRRHILESGVDNPENYQAAVNMNDDSAPTTLSAPSSASKAFRQMLEPVGGAVPLDSGFYLVRPTDDRFRAAIMRQDSIVLVKGARQVGKTSLLARGLEDARRSGARVVLTDLQNTSASSFESVEKVLLTFADCFADQLDLNVFPSEVWKPNRSPVTNFEQYLRREALLHVAAPIVWGLDEVDRLFTCTFGSEIFGLFRSWHNKRALDPAGPWRRLTLAIAYATEAHLFITDLNQSPFNVGTRLMLEDFTLEQVEEINRLYGSPLREGSEVVRYFSLVSGHPYLIRRGFYEMVANGFDLPALEAKADHDAGPFGDHLRRMLFSLSQDRDLFEVVRGLLQGEPCASSESFYRLRSAGVVLGDSARDARLRCRLYATYLEGRML
ncbi:MAG TPA: serine/threonine-protein kinase [Blastocatellia bacterium]|jgi:serine/threonine protein kinase|nr:serine/threonine-protein kinase [Blastocatellia bacterium]